MDYLRFFNGLLLFNLFLIVAPISAAEKRKVDQISQESSSTLKELFESRPERIPVDQTEMDNFNKGIIKKIGTRPINWSKEDTRAFFSAGGIATMELFEPLMSNYMRDRSDLTSIRLWIENGGSLNDAIVAIKYETTGGMDGRITGTRRIITDPIDTIVDSYGHLFDTPSLTGSAQAQGVRNILKALLVKRDTYHDQEYLNTVAERILPERKKYKTVVIDPYRSGRDVGSFQQLPSELIELVKEYLD